MKTKFILFSILTFALANLPIASAQNPNQATPAPTLKMGTLLEPVQFPILINGKPAGSTSLPKGTSVRVDNETGDKVLITTKMGSTWAPKTQVALPTPAPTAEQPLPITQTTPRKARILADGKDMITDALESAGYHVDIINQELRPYPTKKDKAYNKCTPEEQRQIDAWRKEVEANRKSVTEADIKNHDVFITSVGENIPKGFTFKGDTKNQFPAALFNNMLHTGNKLLLAQSLHRQFISEIRRYGTNKLIPGKYTTEGDHYRQTEDTYTFENSAAAKDMQRKADEANTPILSEEYQRGDARNCDILTCEVVLPTYMQEANKVAGRLYNTNREEAIKIGRPIKIAKEAVIINQEVPEVLKAIHALEERLK